jgi:hypothetical protein
VPLAFEEIFGGPSGRRGEIPQGVEEKHEVRAAVRMARFCAPRTRLCRQERHASNWHLAAGGRGFRVPDDLE